MHRSEEYEFVLMTVRDSQDWIDIKQIARLSGVSLAKCRILLGQMTAQDLIASKHQASAKSPDGLAVYAKKSIASNDPIIPPMNSEFKEAISKFKLWPHLMDGKTHQVYAVPASALPTLAMLSRRR